MSKINIDFGKIKDPRLVVLILVCLIGWALIAHIYNINTLQFNASMEMDFEELVLRLGSVELALEQTLNSSFYGLQKPCSYMISQVGSYTCMQNGTTGKLDAYNTNASQIINNAEGHILLKANVFSLDSSIILSANDVLEGEGWGNYPHDTEGTVLKKTGNFDMIVYNNSAGSIADTSFEIKNLMLFCDGATYSGKGIVVDTCKNFVIDHVLVTRARCAVHIKDSGVHWIINSRFIETYDDGTYDFVIREEGSSDWQIRGNDLGGAEADWTTIRGIYVSGGGGIISGNKIFLVETGIESTSTTTIFNNWINDFYQYGLVISGQDSKANDNFIYYIDAVTFPPAANAIGILINNNHISCTDNTIKDADDEYSYGIYEQTGKDNNVIMVNIIRGTVNGIRVVGANTICRYNSGYTTENSGTSEASNDDWIAHELAGTPYVVTLTIEETDANYCLQLKASNNTHFQIYLYDLTASTLETVDKTINWYVEYKP